MKARENIIKQALSDRSSLNRTQDSGLRTADSRLTTLLVLFVVIKFVLQYVLNGSPDYELHRDEYLHLDQGRHLAWGYHSVPPFTSWISWIIIQLGNTPFWVRFFPALFGAITIVLVWKTVEVLGGRTYALVLAGIAITFSSMLRLNMLYQPNSADIMFWTLVCFSLVKYVRSERPGWIYLAAAALAAGLLNKYNILFCLMGLLPAIAFTGTRKIFADKHLYLAMVMALLIVSPNIWWQYKHDFPVFAHMQELQETQLNNLSRAQFFKEQFFMFMPAVVIIIAALFSFWLYEPFRKYRFVFLGFLFTMALFVYFKAKGYYAYGAYPVLLAFGAVYLEFLLGKGRAVYLRIPLALLVLLLFLPFLLIAFPIKSPAAFYEDARQKKAFSEHTWEDGRKYPISQDFADMQGWKELAEKTDSIYIAVADPQHTMVLADNYGQAGAINYYSKFKDINAVSFNADYPNWFRLDTEIRHIIRIKTLGEEKPSAMEIALFKQIRATGRIENRYAREYGTTIYICSEPTQNINELLSSMLRKAAN